MIRFLLHRILGWGRLPTAERKPLTLENPLLVLEGLSGAIHYRDFRAPGRVFRAKREWFMGSLVITDRRFTVYAFSRRVIHLPRGGHELRSIDLHATPRGQLCIGCDASVLSPDQSGTIEFRIHSPRAAEVVALMRRQT